MSSMRKIIISVSFIYGYVQETKFVFLKTTYFKFNTIAKQVKFMKAAIHILLFLPIEVHHLYILYKTLVILISLMVQQYEAAVQRCSLEKVL